LHSVRYGKLLKSHLKHARFDVLMVYDNDLLGCDTCVLVDGYSVTEKQILEATVFCGALVSICQGGWHRYLMCVTACIVKSLCHI